MSKDIQPIFIMPEGTQRTTGKTAQRNNIMAAKLVAETVRTTLGPKGMDKMIADSANEVIITNDGVTILEEMQIEHPAAKMIVEIAKTQEDEIGDGTTTAVVIAGELLKTAEYLLDKEVHPTVLAKGYRLAEKKAQEILLSIAENISIKDDNLLKKIAMTAMTGKGAENAKEHLSNMTIKAIKIIAQDGKIDRRAIRIEKKMGKSVDDSELIAGIVLDKERVHPQMPMQIDRARIALIDGAIEIKSTEIDAKIQITDPSQLQAFLNKEEQMLQDKVDAIIKAGANVLICQKGIDDLAQHILAKQGIYAIRRAKKSDMEALAKATGANIITNVKDLSQKDIGFAGLVEQVRVGDEEMTYIRECRGAKSVTILIRGSTEHVIAEIKRALEDAIGDVAASLDNGKIVGGAGAPEMELSKGLSKYAQSLSGREQLAVQAFADAMDVIPRTLAENAGLDPIDVLTALKAKHDQKQKWAGIDVYTGKTMNSFKNGVIEPLKIKTQAISSAAEVAVMILRIDDVIAGSPNGPSPGPDPSQMMPGMG